MSIPPPCFPFLHSRHSSSRSSKSYRSLTLKYEKIFVSGHPTKSRRLIFSLSANISYSLILRSQLPTPALAARPTLHKCNAAKEKFLFSLQKQTWIIKRTLSIWIIIILQYSGDTRCGHRPMGGHSREGRTQGCQVDIYNLSKLQLNSFLFSLTQPRIRMCL